MRNSSGMSELLHGWRCIRHMSKLEMLTKLNDICLFVKDFQGALKFTQKSSGSK